MPSFGMKKYIAIMALTMLVIPSFVPLWANEGRDKRDDGFPSAPPSVEIYKSNGDSISSSTISETNLSKLIARGVKLIDQRVRDLTKSKTKIAKSKLTDAQKTTLTTKVDEQIAKLNDLRAKISSGTDLVEVKALVQSIYTDYRIYAVFLPKISLYEAIYGHQNYLTKLNDYLASWQTKIDQLKEKHKKDIDARQADLDKAKAIVPTIQPKLDVLMQKTNELVPSDYPATYKTEIDAIRAGLKEISGLYKNAQQMSKKWK
jgi:hypothetical protein